MVFENFYFSKIFQNTSNWLFEFFLKIRENMTKEEVKEKIRNMDNDKLLELVNHYQILHNDYVYIKTENLDEYLKHWSPRDIIRMSRDTNLDLDVHFLLHNYSLESTTFRSLRLMVLEDKMLEEIASNKLFECHFN